MKKFLELFFYVIGLIFGVKPTPIKPIPTNPVPPPIIPIPPPVAEVDPTPVDPNNPIRQDKPGKHDTSLLNSHNALREVMNLKLLSIDLELTKAAINHSIWMAQSNKMDHTEDDRSGPWERIQRTNYRGSRIGENIAMGYPSVTDVMRGWRNSPGHYKNIIGQYADVGFGVVARGNTFFWTAVFGAKNISGQSEVSVSFSNVYLNNKDPFDIKDVTNGQEDPILVI